MKCILTDTNLCMWKKQSETQPTHITKINWSAQTKASNKEEGKLDLKKKLFIIAVLIGLFILWLSSTLWINSPQNVADVDPLEVEKDHYAPRENFHYWKCVTNPQETLTAKILTQNGIDLGTSWILIYSTFQWYEDIKFSFWKIRCVKLSI